MKKNVIVVFGGRTAEHDVSIITGLQACENLDAGKYDIHPVYISRQGQWFTGERLLDPAFYSCFNPRDKKLKRALLSADGTDRTLYSNERRLKPLFEIDAAVLALHGLHGEDGTVQGLLELKDIPYTSCGVTGSAVGMDKIVMKDYFRGLGLPVIDAVCFERDEYPSGGDYPSGGVIGRVESAFGYPVFVKPANLGSSIGISKARNKDELISAIEVALEFDRRVLVEPAVEDIMEVNCSVLGYGAACECGAIEQPVAWDEFLTFDEKYLRNEKGAGMKSLTRKIPADIPEAMAEQVRSISKKIFIGLDLKGVVRIDFIIDKSAGKLYVNELNTIPGSFAYYLWEPQGVSFRALLDRLIADAQKSVAEKRKSSFAYASDILKKAPAGLKGGAKPV